MKIVQDEVQYFYLSISLSFVHRHEISYLLDIRHVYIMFYPIAIEEIGIGCFDNLPPLNVNVHV